MRTIAAVGCRQMVAKGFPGALWQRAGAFLLHCKKALAKRPSLFYKLIRSEVFPCCFLDVSSLNLAVLQGTASFLACKPTAAAAILLQGCQRSGQAALAAS